MRVCIWPSPSGSQLSSGIGRVVHAQYRYLPQVGIEVTDNPDEADLIFCHTQQGNMPRVDVLGCHGLYFQDIHHAQYASWHQQANASIIEATRQAFRVTVPSEWVAEPFKRDMRISPDVVPHGIEAERFVEDVNGGYILWNKNRAQDVCDPTPALELARRGRQVISTFAPHSAADIPGNMWVTGSIPWNEMMSMVAKADIYLATTRETFGLGTLEAMAAGVPVLGYRWGGTADIVRHEIDGFLVQPGDIEGLNAAVDWVASRRRDLGHNARERAREFTWDRVAARYAEIYRAAYAARLAFEKGEAVAVIIPCFNYGRYLIECVESVLAQTVPASEIIIVDDGSTDDSEAVGRRLAEHHSKVRYIWQANQGVAAARNNGIAEAKSPLIVCLDADDRLASRYLEACTKEMQRDRGLGIVYTGLEVHYEENQRVEWYNWPPPFDWKIQSKATVPPSNCVPSAAMFRRSMWERAGGYEQHYAPGEDAEFWTRGLSVGFRAKRASDHRLFLYRAHSKSASRMKKYVATDEHHPWMRDDRYPMGAPASDMPDVMSYADPVVSLLIHGRIESDWKETLEDILGQTVRAWEAIAVTPALSAEVLRVYPFVRQVAPKEPTEARGRFTVDVKAGEALLPDMLESELRILAEGRLGPKSKLKENPMGCGGGCGDGKGDQNVARQAVEGTDLPLPATAVREGSTGWVRMEFVGTRSGAVTYHGAEGRMYRGGNNPVHKFASVHPDDVTRLVRLGLWRVVEAVPVRPMPPAPIVPKIETIPPEAEAVGLSIVLEGVLNNGQKPKAEAKAPVKRKAARKRRKAVAA